MACQRGPVGFTHVEVLQRRREIGRRLRPIRSRRMLRHLSQQLPGSSLGPERQFGRLGLNVVPVCAFSIR